MLIFHARQLEQELNEVINRGDSYGQKYAACMLERDQLRKVADKLAFQLAVTHRETGCLSQCPVIATLDSYNQLPHVKERNEK